MENGTWQGKGVAFIFLNFLAEKFNFTYEVSLPEENRVGIGNDKSIVQMLVDNVRF